MMRNLIVILAMLVVQGNLQAQQSLRLEDCYKIAKENYPLTRQKKLIASSAKYSVENAAKGYLPQLNFYGQASYQSAVTQIPIKIPGVNIQTISKDQYRLYGEVYQPITETAVIGQAKQLATMNADAETDKLEVELYKLNDRINQLFFGILLMDEQKSQVAILKKDIQEGIDKLEAMVKSGVALPSNTDVLKAEMLKAEQKEIELSAAKKAYLQMLGAFLNRDLNDSTMLEKPLPSVVPVNPGKDSFQNRPEISLFMHQFRMLDIQQKYLTAKNLPRLGLFFQGGVGRPALNMLNNDFALYYIGGLRFNWNFSGLYTLKNDRRILDVNRSMLQAQKESFLFNNRLSVMQQNAEISKWTDLIDKDRQIVGLRDNIKKTTKIQMENGTATSMDYARELNAQDQARQNLSLHEIQWLMAQYSLKNTIGEPKTEKP